MKIDAISDCIVDYQKGAYTIHEVDTRKVQLVPSEINDRYDHNGGVSDCKKCGK